MTKKDKINVNQGIEEKNESLNKNKKYCTNCGEELDEKDKFCDSCGQ